VPQGAHHKEKRLIPSETHHPPGGGSERRRPALAALAVAGLLLAPACASNEVTNPTPTNRVTKAGWSFGFCLGACRGDLSIDADRLDYRMRDRAGEETLLANAGSLTDSGRARLAELATALGATPLQDVYGCPDCADGGAAYLELQRPAGLSTTRYEYRQPPPSLQALDDFLAQVIEALQTCAATSAVQLDAGCQPLVR
jgi:hypothetical protein